MPRLVDRGKGWLVVDKPAGLPTIPDRGGKTSARTLLERKYGPLLVVHRLDRITCGLLLFATDPDCHRRLCIAFEARTVKKLYLARVAAAPVRPAGLVELPITDGRRGVMRIAAAGEGRPAETGWCRLRDDWLLAAPKQGRRHQVRLHLAAAGMPLLGDRIYYPAARVLAGFQIPPGAVVNDPAPHLCAAWLHPGTDILPDTPQEGWKSSWIQKEFADDCTDAAWHNLWKQAGDAAAQINR